MNLPVIQKAKGTKQVAERKAAGKAIDGATKGAAKVFKAESKGQTKATKEALKNVGEAIRKSKSPEERKSALESNERIHRDSLTAGHHRMEQGSSTLLGLAGLAVLATGAVVGIMLKDKLIGGDS